MSSLKSSEKGLKRARSTRAASMAAALQEETKIIKGGEKGILMKTLSEIAETITEKMLQRRK